MIASAPDLFRLVAVPVFAWAAYRDVRTRRVPNRVWPPLYLLGAALLLWDVAARWPLAGVGGDLFLTRIAVSLLVVAPLGYAFWYVGGFGGADAKALIALALLFPTYPSYYLPIAWLPAFPAVRTYVGVFSLTVLTNAVILGALYPVGLGAYNAARGRFSAAMFLAKRVPIGRLPHLHGRLFETRAGFTRRGLDLDALRMYLRWRGLRLTDVRADPDRFRDPASVGETHDPTDGGTHVGPATDGGESVGEDLEDAAAEWEAGRAAESKAAPTADPWAAERFLAEIEGSAYGTDPEALREGLETVAARETVWVSPGMPFVVPLFVGLVLGLTYGDLLFALLRAVGAA
ncbi:prepilin peptidase [Haloparvum sedimenti]|uniref:prepilin peptidase n=1 Tax=Haloparvum sedimenti TaxID=1678448 RepID=UPI00071E7C01|nr:prepilin peptidase [Haloparvum sedimenti]